MRNFAIAKNNSKRSLHTTRTLFVCCRPTHYRSWSVGFKMNGSIYSVDKMKELLVKNEACWVLLYFLAYIEVFLICDLQS